MLTGSDTNGWNFEINDELKKQASARIISADSHVTTQCDSDICQTYTLPSGTPVNAIKCTSTGSSTQSATFWLVKTIKEGVKYDLHY